MRNASFLRLLERAKYGDAEAMKQVVDRLEPLLRKYSSRLGYDDARSELIEWVLRAIQRYPLASPRPIPHPQRLSKPTVNSGRVSVEELPSHQELTTWEQ